MEPNTIRLPAETWTELADEADDLGFHSRSAYLRWILQHRDVIEANTDPNTPPNTTEYDALASKVAELERRLKPGTAPPEPDPTPDPVTVDDVPGSGREAEARREAVQAALDALETHGEASTGHLKATAWDAYLAAHAVADAAGLSDLPFSTYGGGSNPKRSLWTNTVLPVLKDRPYVGRPEDEERKGGYVWVG